MLNHDKGSAQQPISEHLGRYLRSIRQQKGLSLRKVAAHVGVTPGYWSRLESGQHYRPSAEILMRFAELCEIEDTTELLDCIGVAEGAALPPAHVYLRRKYGLSEDDADRIARLIEEHKEGKSKHDK